MEGAGEGGVGPRPKLRNQRNTNLLISMCVSSPCVCVSDAEPTEYQLRTGNARMAYHVIEGALKAGLKGLVLPVVDHKD